MRLGAVAVLLAALLLSACRDGGETRYRHDFADGHGGWGTSRTLLTAADLPASYRTCWVSWLSLYACNIDAPVQNGRMQLTSPWWLDPNHAPPGAGYLSLITWVYLDGPAGSSTFGKPTLDLTGTTLEVALRAPDLELAGGRLMFFFNTSMPGGKYANYAYSRTPIDAKLRPGDRDLTLVEIKLSSDADAWTCLGTSDVKSDLYACVDVTQAMRAIDNAFGFMILPVSDSPLPEDQPSGHIEIQSVELVRR